MLPNGNGRLTQGSSGSTSPASYASAVPPMPVLPNGVISSAGYRPQHTQNAFPSGQNLHPYSQAAFEHLAKSFVEAEFADVDLTASYADGSTQLFKLHSLIVSRSPVLTSLMNTTSRHHLALSFASSPLVTSTSLNLALATLYSPTFLPHITPANALAVLSTALSLDLPWLAEYAHAIYAPTLSALKSAADVVAAWNDVAHVPDERLRAGLSEALLERLTTTLPLELGVFTTTTAPPPQASSSSSSSVSNGKASTSTAGAGEREFVRVLVELPFQVVKRVLESPELPVAGEMERFHFAKKVIADRNSAYRRRSSSSPSSSTSGGGGGQTVSPTRALAGAAMKGGDDGAGGEESVVLGFGAGESRVEVIRKARRPVLWKVGG